MNALNYVFMYCNSKIIRGEIIVICHICGKQIVDEKDIQDIPVAWCQNCTEYKVIKEGMETSLVSLYRFEEILNKRMEDISGSFSLIGTDATLKIWENNTVIPLTYITMDDDLAAVMMDGLSKFRLQLIKELLEQQWVDADEFTGEDNG